MEKGETELLPVMAAPLSPETKGLTTHTTQDEQLNQENSATLLVGPVSSLPTTTGGNDGKEHGKD
jgi:hypothetical protein